VRDALGGRPLDLLLIDGDHRYRGVTADFDTYTPLLRPGGLIVLHDIVPDRALRDGAEEGEFVGGVPRFWQVLKDRFPDTEEIIADPEQLGAGFGLVKWPGDRLTR
jgi:predicted O-methyltransferase YrrM